MSRLYQVNWTGCCFVLANSASEAERIATGEVTDQQMLRLDSFAFEAKGKPPSDWADAIPLGDQTDERTVAQILTEQEASK